MISKNSNTLQVLDNFVIDFKISPKYADQQTLNRLSSGSISNFTLSGNIANNSRTEYQTLIDYFTYIHNERRNFFTWFQLKCVRLFGRFFSNEKISSRIKKFKAKKIKGFFDDVHKAISVSKLFLNKEDVDFYVNAVDRAVKNGQEALAEILINKKQQVFAELELFNKGITTYISEDDVVDFYKKVKTDKFLKLTWIKNYTRLIPDEVLAKKKAFDDKRVFDNYVILHFDIAGDAVSMTNKEKEQAKDPILFGVVQNSRKLYFVGDWEDEYCDLTLDKFLKKIQKDKPSELSVKEIIKTT